MYKPIVIDRKNRTIMGVPFPDAETLESAAAALGTNMFEGYEPTPRGVAIFRDYITDKITLADVAKAAKEKAYA
jgi:putative transcriptional regulator